MKVTIILKEKSAELLLIPEYKTEVNGLAELAKYRLSRLEFGMFRGDYGNKTDGCLQMRLVKKKDKKPKPTQAQ